MRGTIPCAALTRHCALLAVGQSVACVNIHDKRHDDVEREDVAVAIHFRADALGFAVAAQTAAANLQRAQALLQAFLERAANGHRFADAFHLRDEPGVGLGNFSKAKRGILVTT
jgi:hypothetical protein